MSKFSDWLLEELNKRDLTYAGLAKEAGISRAMISLTLSEDRRPGPKTVDGLARAFGYEPADVAHIAGLLREKPMEDIAMKEWIAAGTQLTEKERAELLEWAWAKVSRRRPITYDATKPKFAPGTPKRSDGV